MKLSAQGLEKSYPTAGDPLVVFDGVDLELASGDTLAITGPSGSGKSTLLHILGTLDSPTNGTLLLDGTDPFGLSPGELAAFRNRSIGFVFQDHYLLPQLSTLENVLVPSLVSSLEPAIASERAVQLLERVGLSSRSGHRPDELSGGERQRAAIARALVLEPGLLLCDEPTGNLDQTTADRVSDLFLELSRDLSTTLVVVTHSARLAGRFARRVQLDRGQLVELAG